jgi:hypothetical protein
MPTYMYTFTRNTTLSSTACQSLCCRHGKLHNWSTALRNNVLTGSVGLHANTSLLLPATPCPLTPLTWCKPSNETVFRLHELRVRGSSSGISVSITQFSSFLCFSATPCDQMLPFVRTMNAESVTERHGLVFNLLLRIPWVSCSNLGPGVGCCNTGFFVLSSSRP